MSAAGKRPARERGSTAGHRSGRGRPFVLNVRSLRSRPGTREEVHLAGPIADMSVSSAEVPEGAEVRFDGWIESTLGGVTVAGRVSAPWSGVCRRCLEEASATLIAEVRELCRDPRDAALDPIGTGEEGDESYVVGADELDVEPVVRDACILELPLAPLCSESCRGLCPTCGANRNRDECLCEQEVDPRWSALAGLVSGNAEAAMKSEQAEQPRVEESDDGRPEEEEVEVEEP